MSWARVNTSNTSMKVELDTNRVWAKWKGKLWLLKASCDGRLLFVNNKIINITKITKTLSSLLFFLSLCLSRLLLNCLWHLCLKVEGVNCFQVLFQALRNHLMLNDTAFAIKQWRLNDNFVHLTTWINSKSTWRSTQSGICDLQVGWIECLF